MPAAFPQCSKPPLNSKTSASPSLWIKLTGDGEAVMEPKCLHLEIKGSQILAQSHGSFSWFVSN